MTSKFKTYISDISLLYAAAVWGSTFILVKDSLSSINPVILVGYRFILASLLMGIYLLIKRISLFSNFKFGFILGFCLWALYIPQTVGLGLTTAANSGLITGLFVVFVPIFSFIFFHIKPSLVKIITVTTSLLGLAILTGGLKHFNYGDLLTIITAVAYAIYILLADKFVNEDLNPLVLSFQQFFTVGFLCLLAGFIFHLSFSYGNLLTLGTISFLAIFPTLSAFVIQLVAQKHTSPVKVALIFAMEPVFAAIFAWTFGHEPFSTYQILGGLLIVSAILLSELPLPNFRLSLSGPLGQ